MSVFLRLREDKRGMTGIQIAGIILAPIVAVIIAFASISVLRTGNGLVDSLQQGTLSEMVLNDFARSAAAATTITAISASSFSTTTDPTKLPPALSVDYGLIGKTCSKETWELKPSSSGFTELVRTQTVLATASCTSAVVTTTTRAMGSLATDAKFTYTNARGRALTASSGTVSAATATAPAGVDNSEWASTAIGSITLKGTMSEMFGNRVLDVTTIKP